MATFEEAWRAKVKKIFTEADIAEDPTLLDAAAEVGDAGSTDVDAAPETITIEVELLRQIIDKLKGQDVEGVEGIEGEEGVDLTGEVDAANELTEDEDIDPGVAEGMADVSEDETDDLPTDIIIDRLVSAASEAEDGVVKVDKLSEIVAPVEEGADIEGDLGTEVADVEGSPTE